MKDIKYAMKALRALRKSVSKAPRIWDKIEIIGEDIHLYKNGRWVGAMVDVGPEVKKDMERIANEKV